MMLKKLRDSKNWSQEQLATLSGLSLRTIQRVEAGNTASLETLKSIASVFEIEVSKLTEEIIVIDKASKEWKKIPLLISMGMWGIRTRKTALIAELLCFILGVIGFIVGLFFYFPFIALTLMWVTAYWLAFSIRWLDNSLLW